MLPEPLAALQRLSRNLWWSWDADAVALWHDIDPWRWERCAHNPVALLADVEPARFDELAGDAVFVARLGVIEARFDAYLAEQGWCGETHPELPLVAYFSMEFGLHESLRIYSGGLGVLAGDHLRSASDLGVPLVGIGLLYREGYFQQMIYDGRQIAAYADHDWSREPIERVLDADGEPLVVEVSRADRVVKVWVWKLAVGRNTLILLDTDHHQNQNVDRALTHHLYGGASRTRIGQEIVLGIGGVRALRAMGLTPRVFHMNEGHCAFLSLELIRERRNLGDSFGEARAWVREHAVFTTHTPVPAGHDRFYWHDLDHELGGYRESQSLPEGTFMDLGRDYPGDVNAPLNMTVLALRFSAKANGVSRLHGEESREMWKHLWPGLPVDDVPIGHITNGVHPVYWMSAQARAVFDEYLPGWRERGWDRDVWEGVDAIPDAVLWELRATLRRRLLDHVAFRTGRTLDPDALTIGFARRFATYKRGDLIFSDLDRLYDIVHGEHPVQFVFSGKAHPQDKPGQKVVERVLSVSNHPDFRDHVVFVPDYDMVVGHLLTSGADVWLNNPRRPREASGTSGQKVPLNGGINLSCLDGWWPEAYDGTNGWAIGGTEVYTSLEEHDAADLASLYQVLEQQVMPEWRARDAEGRPAAWLARVRRSIKTCAPEFSSHRMVRDYVQDLYAPLAAR